MDTSSFVEDQNQNIWENIRDIIFTLSLDGIITSCTREFENVTEWSRDEWIGRSFLEIVHPDDTEGVTEGFEATLRGETVPPYEARIKTKSGEILTLEVKATSQVFNGKVIGYLGIARDITERKQAEELLRASEQQYRNMINFMGDAIHVIDKHFNILLANPAFSKWVKELDLNSEIAGKPLHKAFTFLDDQVIEEYRSVFSSGETLVTEEKTIINGKTLFTETRKIPIIRHNEVVQIITIIRNITERKKIENQLIESEEKYRELISNLTDVVSEVDSEGNFIFVSPQVFDSFGYYPDELIGKNSIDFIHSDDIESSLAFLEEILAEKRILNYEFRIKNKKGDYVPVAASGRAVDHNGNLRLIFVLRDITERKKMETALHEGEERLRGFMEGATDSFALWDSELNLVDVNKTALTAFGFVKKDILGKNITEFHTNPKDIKNYKKVLESGNPFIADIIASPQKYGNLILSVKAFKVGDGLGIIATDITERKRAEDELLKTKMRLEYLLKENPAVIYSCSLDGHFETTFMSENIKEILGHRVEDFIHNPEFWEANLHPDDRNKVLSTFKEIKNKGSYSDAYRFKHKDGSYRWMLEEANLTNDSNGNPLEVIGYWTDITERKIVEEDLRASEGKFRSIFENAPIGMALIDLDFGFSKQNTAFCQMTGYSAKDLTQLSLHDIIHPDYREKTEKQAKRIYGKNSTIQTERRYVKKNGDEFWGRTTSTLLREDHRDAIFFILMVEDITRIKQSEELMKRQLIKYQVEDGNIYLVKENTPILSQTVFKELLKAGYRGVIFSRSPKRDYSTHIEVEFTYHRINEESKIEDLMENLEDTSNKSVILIDRIEYLVTSKGFNQTIQFIYRLGDIVYLKSSIAILVSDTLALSKKELRILEKETKEIELRSLAALSEENLEVMRLIYQKNNLGIKPSYSDIGKELNISRPTTRRRIKKLLATGYLIDHKKGNSKVLECTDKGRLLFLK
ncbi:MAG: PAS domain S-box protein [Promethearchaeota archaeon]